MAKVELKEYGHAGRTAEEVVSAWKRNVLLARVFGVVGVVAVAVALFLLRGFHTLTDVLLLVVLWIVVLLFAYGGITREFIEVQKILTVGCDPKLLRKVMDLRLAEQLKPADRQTMGAVCAQAAALAGDGDDALEMVRKIEAEGPKDRVRALLLNVRAAVARQAEDLDELKTLREQAVAMGKGGTKAIAGQALTGIDLGIALCEGRYEDARGLANKVAAEVMTPQANVAREFAWAQACEREGVKDEARDHYAYVAKNGGTLNAQRVATKKLKSLGR